MSHTTTSTDFVQTRAGALPHSHIHSVAAAVRRHGELLHRHQTVGNGLNTCFLLATGMNRDPSVWTDLFSMQQALWDGLVKIGENWIKGIEDIEAQTSQISSANTFFKLIEQECNVAQQFVILSGQQFTDLAQLFESFQVGYSYWLSQKMAYSIGPKSGNRLSDKSDA